MTWAAIWIKRQNGSAALAGELFWVDGTLRRYYNVAITEKGDLALLKNIKISYCVIALLASAFLAFGLYHVHSFSGVTEGGVLGMTLLLQQWFRISPAVSGFALNILCYLIGWRELGREFILYSTVATVGFSGSYRILEQFEPLWPNLYRAPLVAAIVGAIFVGVGVGICVRVGGAPTGDDALAMALSHRLGVKIQWVYLVSDLLVLGLSLSYIPLGRLWYSLFTVILSGQIVGFMQRTSLPGTRF